MIIKRGYNNKKLEIRINGSPESRTAEMWVNFENEPKKETLSYLNLEELLDLKKEIQEAINKITG